MMSVAITDPDFKCFEFDWNKRCFILGVVILFSLTEAPLPDPTPPNTPKRTRRGPETEPNGPERSQKEPKWTEIKPPRVGRPGGVCWDRRGGGCKGKRKSLPWRCGGRGPFLRNFRWPQPPSTFSKSTAVQMGGVLQYKWEVYCWFPCLQGLEARKVLRYKWGACCRTNWRCTAVLSSRPVAVGVSETLLNSI